MLLYKSNEIYFLALILIIYQINKFYSYLFNFF